MPRWAVLGCAPCCVPTGNKHARVYTAGHPEGVKVIEQSLGEPLGQARVVVLVVRRCRLVIPVDRGQDDLRLALKPAATAGRV